MFLALKQAVLGYYWEGDDLKFHRIQRGSAGRTRLYLSVCSSGLTPCCTFKLHAEFDLSSWRQREVDLCEVEDSLAYIESSRLARAA